MTTVILSLFILFNIIYYIIIFHIILSWLSVFWLIIRIKFIDELIIPIYSWIKKIIPTNIWPFDFTPIILLMIMMFLRWLLILMFPEISDTAINILW